MRKLSQIMKKPVLVLFENVLDGEKVLQSEEVQSLTRDIVGHGTMSIAEVEKPEELLDWLRDEMYKSLVGNRSMIYPFKAKFESLATENHREEYSGPLSAILFTPSGTENPIICLCCHWQDSALPIRNDEAIIGVIAEEVDLKSIEK